MRFWQQGRSGTLPSKDLQTPLPLRDGTLPNESEGGHKSCKKPRRHQPVRCEPGSCAQCYLGGLPLACALLGVGGCLDFHAPEAVNPFCSEPRAPAVNPVNPKPSTCQKGASYRKFGAACFRTTQAQKRISILPLLFHTKRTKNIREDVRQTKQGPTYGREPNAAYLKPC